MCIHRKPFLGKHIWNRPSLQIKCFSSRQQLFISSLFLQPMRLHSMSPSCLVCFCCATVSGASKVWRQEPKQTNPFTFHRIHTDAIRSDMVLTMSSTTTSSEATEDKPSKNAIKSSRWPSECDGRRNPSNSGWHWIVFVGPGKVVCSSRFFI